MNAIKATWRKGRIVPDAPVDWPEGCRLLVEPVHEGETIGITEGEWPKTPEERAEWLKWFDSVKPVKMTPAEEAEWQAYRQKIKEYTIANMHKRIEGLFE